MKYIKTFEKLSINNDVEILSNEVYEFLIEKPIGIYTFRDSESNLPIKEIIIHLFDNDGNVGGTIELDKCHKNRNNEWTIYMTIKVGFKRHIIQHECNHILQLIKSKKNLQSKMNYINSGEILEKKTEFTNFFILVYFASDHEIESIINDSYSYLRDIVDKNTKIDNETFNNLIKEMKGYIVAKSLINFNIDYLFKDMSEEEINRFFISFAETKQRLDNFQNKDTGFIAKIKSFYEAFAFIFLNKKLPELKYKVRGKAYYQKFINSQGEKLRRKMFKLYDHFT